jgi:hypothetical protein
MVGQSLWPSDDFAVVEELTVNYDNVHFFQPRRPYQDSTVFPPTRCTCHELTGGLCAYCVMPMPAYTPPTPLNLEMNVTIDLRVAERTMRTALSAMLRKFADREAGPVGIRLRQIADVFEEAA